jgi:NAD(P)H-hydrate epimerase
VILVLVESTRLTPVGEQQLAIYRKTGRRTRAHGSFESGLILDAVFGYGLHGSPRGHGREMIQAMKESAAPVISLDVPSGLDSTTGQAPGESVEALTTLTLALPKTGLFSTKAGDLWLGDLGIPKDVYDRAGIDLPRPVFDGRHRIPLHRQGS